jgi:hypothetical protein
MSECAAFPKVEWQMECLLQEWLDKTTGPFDTGERLPVTEMLDLGQVLAHPDSYEIAPPEYSASIRKNLSSVRPWW